MIYFRILLRANIVIFSQSHSYFIFFLSVQRKFFKNYPCAKILKILYQRDDGEAYYFGRNGYYAAGTLYVTKTTDEDNNISYEFKDKLGQTVLQRQMDGNERYDTYYVYDDSGNLDLVFPPAKLQLLICEAITISTR